MIQGILKEKPRILVTHQLQFLPVADHIIILKEVSHTQIMIFFISWKDAGWRFFLRLSVVLMSFQPTWFENTLHFQMTADFIWNASALPSRIWRHISATSVMVKRDHSNYGYSMTGWYPELWPFMLQLVVLNDQHIYLLSKLNCLQN